MFDISERPKAKNVKSWRFILKYFAMQSGQLAAFKYKTLLRVTARRSSPQRVQKVEQTYFQRPNTSSTPKFIISKQEI